jgi:uncharacterized protein (TIGR03437 family)
MKSVIALLVLSPIFAQTTVTYSYNGLPLPVFNDASNVITVANIFVPQTIKMTKVTVQVQIQYPNSGDLNLYLYSPAGTRTILLEHNCGVANVNTTFDDSAPSAWKDFCPVEAGRGPFRPDQPLANFNNDDSSFGYWQLAVNNDQSDSRSGWLTSVSINITGNSLTTPIIRSSTVVNAANVRNSGSIAPGELVSVYGLALGPDPAVSAPSSGNLPTSLGGSSVTINGTPAPISYASLYRIDFQAPFGLTTGSNAMVQVTSNNQSSAPVPVSVVAAAPALFTRSVDGTGQVMAFNQGGSANSVMNPGAKGSTISLYASGLGATSPTVPAGTAPPNMPLSTVSGVTATVGGTAATVQFAGLAPGLPGIYQLNIQVPSNASSGAEELIVSVSGQPSQRGALIQVQ